MDGLTCVFLIDIRLNPIAPGTAKAVLSAVGLKSLFTPCQSYVFDYGCYCDNVIIV